MRAPTILVVDDNPEDVLFLKKAFDKAGLCCTIEVADDGESALEMLGSAARETGPSHVILDLKLARKPGLDVLAWIRSNDRMDRLPVIVLTSSELRVDIDRVSALGVDAYLVKPVSFKLLQEAVDTIASLWKLPREVREALSFKPPPSGLPPAAPR